MQINLPSSLQAYIGPQLGPLKAYRFLVEVDGSAVGAFSQFSGIRMEVQTITARSGNDLRGVRDTVPVLTSYEPVTLTKGVLGDNAFMDWLAAASASSFTGPTGVRLYRTISVVALDDTGRRGVIWTLEDAMPVRYELSPMDSSRSEVLSESVTFDIGGVERTVGAIQFVM